LSAQRGTLVAAIEARDQRLFVACHDRAVVAMRDRVLGGAVVAGAKGARETDICLTRSEANPNLLTIVIQ